MDQAMEPSSKLVGVTKDQDLVERGLTGRLIRIIRTGAWVGKQRSVKKELSVIETLAIAPKTSLLLVNCGTERFLVGTGSEGVQTIVRLNSVALYSEAFTQDGKQ